MTSEERSMQAKMLLMRGLSGTAAIQGMNCSLVKVRTPEAQLPPHPSPLKNKFSHQRPFKEAGREAGGNS